VRGLTAIPNGCCPGGTAAITALLNALTTPTLLSWLFVKKTLLVGYLRRGSFR